MNCICQHSGTMTCDSGYDYTLYGPDNKALDGGQLDAPGLTLPDAGQEALALLGQTAAGANVIVAGSAIFNSDDIKSTVDLFRKNAFAVK